MNDNDFSVQTTRLKEILLSEKELLLTGRAREVASLVEEKMGAMQDLETYLASREPASLTSEHRAHIETIVRLSKENSVHFEAVRNGLRHAIERLETMHGSVYVGSYTQDGSKIPFTEVTGQFRRKA